MKFKSLKDAKNHIEKCAIFLESNGVSICITRDRIDDITIHFTTLSETTNNIIEDIAKSICSREVDFRRVSGNGYCWWVLDRTFRLR